MKLYFLRHAIAVKRGHALYPKDALRPLTTKGKLKFQSSCSGIKKLKPKWDVILTSPYVRAKETAQILAEYFDCKSILQETSYLTPQHSTSALLKALTHYKESSSIVLVGHEPSLTKHIAQLVSPQNTTHLELKKGGLALVEFSDHAKLGSGVLKYLLTPALLLQLGHKK